MTKDKERESSGEMLQRLGMDGKLWAEEMHKYFPQVAEDELLGWCCNMIMAGYDEAMRRCAALDTSDELVEALLWVREYIRRYVIIHPSSTTDGATPEQKICHIIDQALAKHKQRKGE